MSHPQDSARPLTAQAQPPLCCHLMIGAAASGKTTAARMLAAHLRNSDGHSPVYIASSEIRTELYGARGVIGSWDAIEARIAERLRAAVSAGQPVILEASYVKRAFRLAITQRLRLPLAVQWIGWWLDTPQEECLQRNRQRTHRVPESVISKHCAQLLQCGGAPRRCEGFAAVVRLESQHGGELAARIGLELERLPQRIAAGLLRDRAHERHGYSRLLVLERLLHLLQLLSRYPKLTATEPPDDPELRQLLAPLPAGDAAQRAAALLARLHGSCYGDPLAVAADLDWLERQGFTASWAAACSGGEGAGLPVIEPPATSPDPAASIGGLAPLADRQAFCRGLTLLRHLLHHPFDRGEGVRIDQHLAGRLNRVAPMAQPWRAREVHELITTLLTPYGFRLPGGSGRGGYGMGTALLSLDQLLQAHRMLELQTTAGADPAAAELCRVLGRRLEGMGLDRQAPPSRAWLEGPPPDAELMGRLEQAIAGRQWLVLAVQEPGEEEASELRGWPLQLVRQGGAWWLVLEHDHVGQPQGLLAAVALTDLRWQHSGEGQGRTLERHREALERSQLLQRRCGGVHLGPDLQAQLVLCSGRSAVRASMLETLRLRCRPEVMAELHRDLQRFPATAVRLSAPLPGHSWGPGVEVPMPLSPSLASSHLYLVEADLPRWVLEGDPQLRRWLFAYGPALRIEAPAALVAEHQRWLLQVLEGYAAPGQDGRNAVEGNDAGGSLGPIRKRAAAKPVALRVTDPSS